MHIFIDESGTFAPDVGGRHSISAVGALVVPSSAMKGFEKLYDRLRIRLPKTRGEVAVLHQSPDKRGVPLPVKMVSQLTQTWHSQVRSFC